MPEQLLKAREERAALRRDMALLQLPSVSLNLNVPGMPKTNEITRKFFQLCLDELKLFLRAHLIVPDEEYCLEITDAAGEFFIAPITDYIYSVKEIKEICERFEETHALGRFLDVDVTDKNGEPVGSGKSKMCFFCGQKPAIECRREGLHHPDAIRQFMFTKMNRYCEIKRREQIAKQLSSLALQAMLYEISLTPKPGLVDKLNNGSHVDMNFHTFLRSSAAISPFFEELVQAGFQFTGKDLANALPIIRNTGLRMERAMFFATNGINTQKGLVFLMSISLFACGQIFAKEEQFDDAQFRDMVRTICRNITDRELNRAHSAQNSHGEEVFVKYQIRGIRGEAEEGFPRVFEYGLPALMRNGDLSDFSLAQAFLAIAAQLPDSNILFRSGHDVWENFRRLASEAIQNSNKEYFVKLIDFCNEKHISPGGSADLLVISIFIFTVKKLGAMGA